MAASSSPASAAPADLRKQIDALLSSLASPEGIPLPANASSLLAAGPAKLIDHTLLAPDSTPSAIASLADEAVSLGTYSICVPSSHIAVAANALQKAAAASTSRHGVLPICVVGFPFGNGNSEGKAEETRVAVQEGAKEVDMVQNVGWVKAGMWEEVYADVKGVVDAARVGETQIPVKVILETAYLTRPEIAASTLVACLAGAAFVKTSTGYASAGAKADDIRLMHHVASPHGVQVKASGGIRSYATLREMVLNGASRVGASGTRKIVHEAQGGSGGAAQESQGQGGGY